MYLEHFGLEESPFRITPHTEFFFSGAHRGETLEALLYAISHDEGIVKVTGEVGSGKTMLCRMLIERLPSNVETVFLANPSFSRDEILLALLDDLNCPFEKDQRSSLVIKVLQAHLIERYADSKRVVLLIDEAHAMPEETLDEIRLLSNLESNKHKLLQIVLFGQQELDDNLRTTLLRPLRERITHSFLLEPLVHADVGQYLMFRMRQAGYRGPDLFDRDALKLIAKSSQGLTRRLNILADKCLLAAFAEGEFGITRKHALAAIRDSGFAPLGARQSSRTSQRMAYLAATLAAVGLAAGGVITGMKFSASADAPTPSGALRPSVQKPPVQAITDTTPAPSPTSAVVVIPAAVPPSGALTAAAPIVLPSAESAQARSATEPAAGSVEVPRAVAAKGGTAESNRPMEHNAAANAASIPIRSAESRPLSLPEPQSSFIEVPDESRPIPLPKPRFTASVRRVPAPKKKSATTDAGMRTSPKPVDVQVPVAPVPLPDARPPSRDD